MRFVDTNVLLYALSKAPDEQDKARIALDILQAEDLATSVQVLQEFYVQATRPSKRDRISHDQAASLIEAHLRFPVQETTVSLVQAALVAKQRFGISYWDAAVVEAARALSCRTLLTEDLSDGQDYDGVRVENPFSSSY
ncbi:MAG TPA: PIN domain-containing protein [Gammaproteobacteria bacterium]|jgi:predicted nucleic acid-binding protein